MKTWFYSLALLLVSSQMLIAHSKMDYLSEMLDINAQWKYYAEYCPKESVQFNSDLDAIQAHLYLVCDALIQTTDESLSNEQRANRLRLIAELKSYASKKVFPTNLYHKVRTPYFVDDFGVHCAVGYLMHRSGYDNLVAQISNNENYSFIEDIKTLGVSSWADKHGFTVDELKWIQPTYGSLVNYLSSVGKGTNGAIIKTTAYLSDGLIVAGTFDTLDVFPCYNIDIFQNNQFSCLGNGLIGEIKDVHVMHNKVVVFGALEFENNIFPMAIWENQIWEYVEIPNREGAKASSGFIHQGFHIAINHPADEHKQEIWKKGAGIVDTWVKELEVNGFITCMDNAQFGIGQIYAGSFNEVYTVNEYDEHIDTLASKNVVFKKIKSILFGNQLKGKRYLIPFVPFLK